MSRPARHPCNGEYRGEKVGRYTQHFINKTRIEVDIGTDILPLALEFGEDRGGQLLNTIEQVEFLLKLGAYGKFARLLLEYLGPRV